MKRHIVLAMVISAILFAGAARAQGLNHGPFGHPPSGIENGNRVGPLNVTGLTTTSTLKVTTGAGSGKLLQSDADGDASWTDTLSLDLPLTQNYIYVGNASNLAEEQTLVSVFASPPAIGGTAPAAGAFTTLSSAKSADIVAASTTDLATATGNYIEITGNTGITSFGTVAAGAIRHLRFMGTPTITYNVTSMILPGARSITAEAGDRATFISLGSGNWVCQEYLKANGRGLGDVVVVTHGATEAATAVSMYGQTHVVTGAYTITIPEVVVGMSSNWEPSTAAVMCLDSNGADQFLLYGSLITAGNKICTSGLLDETIGLEVTRAHIIRVYPRGNISDSGA